MWIYRSPVGILKMSEVQRMCKTVQDATSTLVADSSHSK